MRYLLHPLPQRAVKAASARSGGQRTGVVAGSRRTLPESSPSLSSTNNFDNGHQVVTTATGTTTTDTARPTVSISKVNGFQNDIPIQKTVSFGQQCSPTCGCVVRFEAHFAENNAANKLDHVSYHAKKVVTSPSPVNDGPLQAQLTSKGQAIMLEPCTCKTLHKLSKATILHLMQESQNRARAGSASGSLSELAQLEFRHVRSSPAFSRAVLAAQGLPSKDTHCIDVLEEALTALCKGYMPLPRRRPVLVSAVAAQHQAVNGIPTQQQQARPRRFRSGGKAQMQRYLKDNADDDDQYHSFLKFGHSWREHADEENFLQGIVDNDEQRSKLSSSTWLSTVLDAFQLLPVSTPPDSSSNRGAKDETALSSTADARMNGKHIEDAIRQHHHDWISFVDEEQLRLEDEKQGGDDDVVMSRTAAE